MGKIHTVEWSLGPLVQNRKFGMDISSQLTEQLSRMIRQCQIFDIKNISIGLKRGDPSATTEINCSGQVYWMEPTASRIKAIKNAFFIVSKHRKMQGITGNWQYDFRIGQDASAGYYSTGSYTGSYPLPNQAIAYDDGNAYSLWMITSADFADTNENKNSVFRTYNYGLPNYDDRLEAPTQVEGWNGSISAPAAGLGVIDWMQNEASLLTTNPFGRQAASEMQQSQTFDVSSSVTTSIYEKQGWTLDLQGNEFLQFLNGLFSVSVDTYLTSGGESDANYLRVTCGVSGWKPYLMGKKKSKSKKRRRK